MDTLLGYIVLGILGVLLGLAAGSVLIWWLGWDNWIVGFFVLIWWMLVRDSVVSPRPSRPRREP